MAVRIRLTRTGRKNLPSYRIAVFDGRTRRDGPSLKVIGWYNPLTREAGKGFKIDEASLKDWVERGAQVTLAVTQLLKRQGVAVPSPAKSGKAPPADGGKRPSKRAVTKDKARMVRRKKKQVKQASRRAFQAKKAAAKVAAGKKE